MSHKNEKRQRELEFVETNHVYKYSCYEDEDENTIHLDETSHHQNKEQMNKQVPPPYYVQYRLGSSLENTKLLDLVVEENPKNDKSDQQFPSAARFRKILISMVEKIHKLSPNTCIISWQNDETYSKLTLTSEEFPTEVKDVASDQSNNTNTNSSANCPLLTKLNEEVQEVLGNLHTTNMKDEQNTANRNIITPSQSITKATEIIAEKLVSENFKARDDCFHSTSHERGYTQDDTEDNNQEDTNQADEPLVASSGEIIGVHISDEGILQEVEMALRDSDSDTEAGNEETAVGDMDSKNENNNMEHDTHENEVDSKDKYVTYSNNDNANTWLKMRMEKI